MQQRSNVNARHSGVESPVPDLLAAWRMHVQGLARLAKAESLTQLNSSRTMLMGPEDKLPFIRSAARAPTINLQYFEVAIKAATKCMRLLMQKKEGFLWHSCSNAEVLAAVWGDIRHFLLAYSRQHRNSAESCFCAATTGLIPTLIRFGGTFASSVHQLKQPPANTAQTAQMSGSRSSQAWILMQELLHLWSSLSTALKDTPTRYSVLIKAAPAVAQLAAVTVPELLQACLDTECSSAAQQSLVALACRTASAAAPSGICYARIICRLQQVRQNTETESQQRPDDEQLLMTDNLTELLLLSLAQLAASLRPVTSTSSPVTAAAPAPETAVCHESATKEQQQATGSCGETKSSCQQHMILSSHAALLHLLASGTCPASCRNRVDSSMLAADLEGNDEGPNGAAEAGISSVEVHMISQVVRSLKLITLQRIRAAGLLTATSHSSSSNSEQQQRWAQALEVFPGHLVMSTMKVLIEVILLSPSGEVSLRAACMELAMLLLHTLRAAAKVTLTYITGSQGQTADCQAAPTSAMSANARTWPLLPAPGAAGLLHPVVQLMSRTVTHSMKESQGQNKQRGASPDDAVGCPTADRLMLLREYGNLLITVCLSVEPKHVAAALRCDPVIRLVAIEAVIRAQACHLGASDNSRQQQQQRQSTPAACAGASALRDIMPDIAGRPKSEAAVLLLPFVLRIMQALWLLAADGQLHAMSHNTTDARSAATNKLAADMQARLFSLSATSMKVMHAAVISMTQAGKAATTGSTTTSDAAEGAATRYTASASSLEAGIAQQQPKACIADEDWMSVFEAVLHIAVGWNTVLKSGSCNRFDQAIVPVAFLLQALGHWVAATVVAHSISSRPKISTTVACSSNASNTVRSEETLGSPLEADVAKGMNTVGDYVQMVSDAVEQMVAWTCADAHPSSATGRQQQRLQHHWDCICKVLIAPRRLRGSAGGLAIAALLELCRSTAGRISNAAASAKGDAMLDNQLCDMRVEGFYWVLQQIASSANAEFPISFCCNNPVCVNLSKLSEYQLVSGEACVCGGCKVARYCSRECQKKHWKQHKEVCRLMPAL